MSHPGRRTEEIYRIFREVQKFEPEAQNESLTLMPWGHCAGMPIVEYVALYRRAADGYRYNNDDLLARSLTRHVPADAGHAFEDDMDDDDMDDDDMDDDDMDDDDMDDDDMDDDDMDDEWDDSE